MEEDDFNRFPTGKIAKGSWCDHCARFNSRPSVCDIIIIRKNNNKVLLEKRNINPQKGWWALC